MPKLTREKEVAISLRISSSEFTLWQLRSSCEQVKLSEWVRKQCQKPLLFKPNREELPQPENVYNFRCSNHLQQAMKLEAKAHSLSVSEFIRICCARN